MAARKHASSSPRLTLAPDLDTGAARADFEAQGYTGVDGVLAPDSASALASRIKSWPYWALVTHIEGQHRSFDAAAMETVPQSKKDAFHALVNREAVSGFQYLYENFALYEGGRNGTLDDPVLRAAFDLVRSEPFLQLLREVSGEDDIAFTDCQLTRYRAGHFLTTHDDDVAGKNRRAAFVLNLTEGWRADHGGQLQLLDEAGDVWRGLVPRFNRLMLFKVPQPHAVSVVAPFAPDARYAITGWARAGAEPALGA
ncbi:2OG-Fe(II) oxygenase [Marinicauda pacifica]|uniref:2OG-Fe(II) oxygenase n=1 Tax=Marinicauda pacifica TaxID=1133559 RepID=UPI0035C7A69D